MKGRGQGTSLATPKKPLPLPGVSRVFSLYFRPNFREKLARICFRYDFDIVYQLLLTTIQDEIPYKNSI